MLGEPHRLFLLPLRYGFFTDHMEVSLGKKTCRGKVGVRVLALARDSELMKKTCLAYSVSCVFHNLL